MFSARCNRLSFSIWKSDQTAAFHNIISIFNLCYISPLLPHVSSTICCREIEVSKDMSLKKRWYFATQICGQAAAPAVRLPLLPKNWPHTPCDSVGQLRTTHAAASVTSLEKGGEGGLTLLVRGLAPFKPTRLALAVQPVWVKRSLDVNASAHVHGRHPPHILSKSNMCAMCREASMASPLQAAASSRSCVRGGARPAC